MTRRAYQRGMRGATNDRATLPLGGARIAILTDDDDQLRPNIAYALSECALPGCRRP
jgi:hypothetical protein